MRVSEVTCVGHVLASAPRAPTQTRAEGILLTGRRPMKYATWALNVMLSEAVVDKLQQRGRGQGAKDRSFGDRGWKV